VARPPRLPDAAILDLIEELRAQHAVLTGIRLREELKTRHGTPCGVTRIYRLLHQATQPRRESLPPALRSSGDDSQLQLERDAALERARLAEDREEHHQVRWAGEIDQLREQVRELAALAHRARWLEEEMRSKSRDLASAYHHISTLEEQLRVLRGD
jgi:uncharacterized protein YhaN